MGSWASIRMTLLAASLLAAPLGCGRERPPQAPVSVVAAPAAEVSVQAAHERQPVTEPWMLELPSVQQVLAAIVGDDEHDTRERQTAAFFILRDYISWRTGSSASAKAPVLNARRKEYWEASKNADGVMTTTSAGQYYRGDFDYHWEVLAQFLSVESLVVLSRLPDYQRIVSEGRGNRAFNEAQRRKREHAEGEAMARAEASRRAGEAARHVVELIAKYGGRSSSVPAAPDGGGPARASCQSECETFSLRIPCPGLGTGSFTEDAYRTCTSERDADSSDCLQACR